MWVWLPVILLNFWNIISLNLVPEESSTLSDWCRNETRHLTSSNWKKELDCQKVLCVKQQSGRLFFFKWDESAVLYPLLCERTKTIQYSQCFWLSSRTSQTVGWDKEPVFDLEVKRLNRYAHKLCSSSQNWPLRLAWQWVCGGWLLASTRRCRAQNVNKKWQKESTFTVGGNTSYALWPHCFSNLHLIENFTEQVLLIKSQPHTRTHLK